MAAAKVSKRYIRSHTHTHTHDTLAACVCAVSCMWATSTATATAITERLSLPTCLTHKTCAYCCDCCCCCLHLHVPHCGCWPLMKSDKLLLFSRSSSSFPCYVCSSNTTDARHFSSSSRLSMTTTESGSRVVRSRLQLVKTIENN